MIAPDLCPLCLLIRFETWSDINDVVSFNPRNLLLIWAVQIKINNEFVVPLLLAKSKNFRFFDEKCCLTAFESDCCQGGSRSSFRICIIFCAFIQYGIGRISECYRTFLPI
jgi:hypothetical protein